MSHNTTLEICMSASVTLWVLVADVCANVLVVFDTIVLGSTNEDFFGSSDAMAFNCSLYFDSGMIAHHIHEYLMLA